MAPRGFIQRRERASVEEEREREWWELDGGGWMWRGEWVEELEVVVEDIVMVMVSIVCLLFVYCLSIVCLAFV